MTACTLAVSLMIFLYDKAFRRSANASAYRSDRPEDESFWDQDSDNNLRRESNCSGSRRDSRAPMRRQAHPGTRYDHLAFNFVLSRCRTSAPGSRRNDPCVSVSVSPGRPDNDFHIPAKGVQEPKQTVEGETIELAPHQGGNLGLVNAQEARGLRLS